MANLISEMARLAQKDEDAVRRIAAVDFRTNEVRAARILIRMLERMEARDDDVIIRTAENGKKYAIDPDSGKIASGPMKGTKVNKTPTKASQVAGTKPNKPLDKPKPGYTEKPPKDQKGRSFEHRRLNLPPKEYGQVMHEMNTDYDTVYKDERIFIHTTIIENGPDKGKHFDYYVENHGFDDYNIFDKVESDG